MKLGSQIFFLTVEEITAAILHEIGHHFTFFMYLAETVKTNIVLSSINRSNYFNSDKKTRTKFLDDIGDILDINIKDNNILSSSGKDVLFTVILSEVTNKPRSDTGSSIYDARTREFLADQYVVMNGAGKDLATGMAKWYKVFGKATVDIDARMKINIFKYIVVALTNIGPQIILTWAIFNETKENLPSSYDAPKLRLIKMKEQLTSILKNRNINKELKIEILDDIDAIDYLINRMVEYQDYTFFILKRVLPWSRKRESISKLQHDYESLAYNDFYKLSAKMSV